MSETVSTSKKKWFKLNLSVNCAICSTPIKVKPTRIKRTKSGKICCSHSCGRILRKELFKGKKNHQFGLTGHLNPSFKSSERVSNYGYILEYCPGHPRPCDTASQTCRVRQHRLVVERNYRLFKSDYFENINGWIVLKKEYDVHHKDGNRKNNTIENLEVITRGEHSSLHNKEKMIVRDVKGRIKSIKKLTETERGVNGFGSTGV